VGEYLRRAEAAGLGWPLPEDLDESALEQRLFPPAPMLPLAARPVPVWEAVHRELKATQGMSLFLLWQEYKAGAPEGFQYSWFCEQYRAWLGKLDLVMRQEHRAGEKCFVDYAGQTVPVIERLTGEARPAHVFVAVLGASNYTYAEATWTEALPDWIGAHVRAFAYFGGITEILVPDNLKSGVHKASRYEPDLNPTYQDLCAHYGVAVIPARVRRPRDKAKVEAGVQVVERWILARLRHAQFFSLAELNQALLRLLEELNTRPFKKLPGSRRTLFETLDRPALRPLPAEPYVYAEWKRARVHIDYHIEVDDHYYSVPYALVKQVLDVRVTAHTVECFRKGSRVASHTRSSQKGRHTTLPEHMPEAHRSYAQWTPQRLIDWAAKTGPATAATVEGILRSRAHPQQGFRSALGLVRLGKDYGAERLEAACSRALAVGAVSFKSVQAILKHGLDRQPLPAPELTPPAPAHENLRGPDYYY
jgi:transposase